MVASRTLRQRKLARALRQARIDAGLTVGELAKLVRMQPGTISKIENLRQTILARTVKQILSACEVGAPLMDTLMRIADESEAVDWWAAYGDTVPDWFRDYVELEGDADEIWTYSPELVDGLLQTPDYAMAMTRLDPHSTPQQQERAVALRRARQAQLDREQPPRLRIVLNESVIRRTVGNEAIMKAQMRHLAEMGRRPNITIQVLEFAAGEHPAMKEGFTLLRFPGDFADMDCVYHETRTGSLWKERPVDLATYSDDFETVARMALSPEKTAALLDSLGGDSTCDGIEGSTDDHEEAHPLADE